MGERSNERVMYFSNGILYIMDGENVIPVETVPIEDDAFEYSPNYDAWIEEFFI